MQTTSRGGVRVGQRFVLHTETVGPLPIVDHFLHRLKVGELLHRYVPWADARLKLAPATALGVLIRNLCLHREATYALGEWAGRFDPAALGIGAQDVEVLNDDRVGRSLVRLFHADRAS